MDDIKGGYVYVVGCLGRPRKRRDYPPVASAVARPVTAESFSHPAGHPGRILAPIMRYPVVAKIATNLIPFAMGSYATWLHIYVGVQSFVGGNVVRSGLDNKLLPFCLPSYTVI